MTRKGNHVVGREASARRTGSRLASQSATRTGDAPPARLLRDLQQSIGNRAVGAALRARRPSAGQPTGGGGTLQRAGDPEGLMKEHHKSGFTYHHIIPENKLEKFWKAVSEKGHLAEIQPGLKSVTERGLAQFNEAALSNLKLDLKKEIPEIAGSWDDEKFVAILKDAKAGGMTSAEMAKKHFPGIEESSHPQNSSYQPIINIFNKRFKVMAQTTESKMTAAVATKDNGYLGDEEAKKAVHQLLMWMPGNIHRGPSTRFTPKDKGLWDKELDDGGDEFEEAAKLIISPTQFQTLTKLNTAIDTYLKTPSTEVLATVASLLDEMKSYSVKDYDASQWVEVTRTVKKTKKTAYTFKKD